MWSVYWKYTKILMFVLLAEKDICEFTRVVRNQSHKLLLFRENRTKPWISNQTTWNNYVKDVSVILTKVKKKTDYKYNPKYK